MTFGEENLVQKLKSRHRESVRDLIQHLPMEAGRSGRKGWTGGGKTTMCKLWEDEYLKSVGGGFCGTCTVKDNRYYEWLLDVAWYINTGNEEGIILGLESEWAHDIDAV